MKGLALLPLLLATGVLGTLSQRQVYLREEFQDGGEEIWGMKADQTLPLLPNHLPQQSAVQIPAPSFLTV